MNNQQTPPTIDLIGIWQGQGETLQFTEERLAALINGQPIEGFKAIINGQTIMYRVMGNTLVFMYRIEGNVVRFFTETGMLQLPYQIQGNTLSYSLNGSIYNATRQGGSQIPKVTNSSPTNGIRPELVGKWSYLANVNTYASSSNSTAIFRFNSDGTYLYGSEWSSNASNYSMASEGADSGTWSATETTITLYSRQNGKQNFALQKVNHPKNHDPMIIFGGRTYVSFDNKPPW